MPNRRRALGFELELDLVSKRAEYARTGITESWILDPRDRTVTVLTLDPATADYVVGGCYVRGESARSVLLDGFSVSVTEVFSQS